MIPRTLFSSEHELFRQSVRTFLEKGAVPYHAQWEKQGHIDRALWSKAGEAGMLCSHLPEEYGGLGADFLYSTVVIEEIGRLGLTGIGFSLHSDIANTPGFDKGKRLEKVGMKAQDTSELFFQDVRVPKENLLGQAGMGFAYLMQELPQERLTVAIGALASAEA
eukprot:gene17637-17472_t